MSLSISKVISSYSLSLKPGLVAGVPLRDFFFSLDLDLDLLYRDRDLDLDRERDLDLLLY